MNPTLPCRIFSGYHQEGHVQGIVVDALRGYVYYSFTTILLKTDLLGNAIGSVCNLAGHLGCLTFDSDDNRVYGSLELKHDGIGMGIIRRTGWDPSSEDSFYLVSFDVDKIDRMNMDAEKDGVMRAVYLRDVVKDYLAIDEASGKKHRYGCSGIDGTALGPVFGADKHSEKKIMIAYGIYSETDREDNDYQVILQYDKSVIAEYAKPLNQEAPHHSGPDTFEKRYFFYTGNTNYGIQNLEYDPYSENWFVSVYCGKKETFTNFRMFVIDGTKSPTLQVLCGRGEETGEVLSNAGLGECGLDGEVYGSHFLYGATGFASLGDGTFYISHPDSNKETRTFASTAVKYRYAPKTAELFEEEIEK